MARSLLLILALTTLGCADVIGQDREASAPPTELMTDLCGCMSAIDIKASDRVVEGQVRLCLERAVLDHPAEVTLILQRRPGSGNKAFRLGAALGGAMQHMCQPFNSVRERLKAIPARLGT